MKRFYIKMAALCLLLSSVHGCSFDVTPGESFPRPGAETEAPPPGAEAPAPDAGDPTPDVDDPAPDADDPALDKDEPTLGEDDPAPDEDDSALDKDDHAPDAGEGGAKGAAPELLINEVRTEASLVRAEFIELRALSAGSLCGVRMVVYRSGSRTPTVFEFPSEEVEAGEFIVLHLRTMPNPYIDAESSARNFWLPGDVSRINVNGAVYVEDRDGRVLGALMLSASADPDWWTGSSRRHFADVAEFLHEQGAWTAPDGGVATPADAVDTSLIRDRNVTPSVSRDEAAANTNTAADWYASPQATPGRPNSLERL